MRSRFPLILLLMALVLQAHAGPKVVLVIIPAVSLEDLTSTNLPNIHNLMDNGSVGLMNSRTAGRLDIGPDDYADSRYTPESGYLTLGAGARAVAGVDAREAFNRDELVDGVAAGEVLRQRTLIDPGNSAVVHIGIAKMQYDNSQLNYKVTIGQLGDALHSAGLKTAVFGNSDDKDLHREAATICVDSKGLVDFGNVKTSRSEGTADFTVVECGETARLDRSRLDLMDRVYQLDRARALGKADRVVGSLLDLMDRETTIILLSPYPSAYTLEKTANSLCPVIFAGPGFGHGLLTSGSTRIPGVITNTDIAPSILRILNIPVPGTLVGRPVTNTFRTSPVDQVLRMSLNASVQAQSQPVLRQVMTTIIVIVCLVTALWFMLPVPQRKWLSPLILLPSSVAPAFLLMSLWTTPSHSMAWLRLVLLAVNITFGTFLITSKASKALMLMSLGFVGLAAIDMITGSSLSRNSIMGYSIVDGARYYGMGNEFMGAFLGAGLVGLGLLFGVRKMSSRAVRIALVIGLLFMIVIDGAPMLGADYGGALAIAAAFGVALLASSTKPIGFRRLVGVALAAGVFIVGLAFLDSLRGQAHETHLGRTLGLLRSGGLGQIGLLIKRKLIMNFFLIRVSVWSRACAVYLISLGLIRHSGGSKLPAHLRIAVVGLAGGTFAALIFNDSGIVAAATCLVYGWSLLLLTALEAEEVNGDGQTAAARAT